MKKKLVLLLIGASLLSPTSVHAMNLLEGLLEGAQEVAEVALDSMRDGLRADSVTDGLRATGELIAEATTPVLTTATEIINELKNEFKNERARQAQEKFDREVRAQQRIINDPYSSEAQKTAAHQEIECLTTERVERQNEINRVTREFMQGMEELVRRAAQAGVEEL